MAMNTKELFGKGNTYVVTRRVIRRKSGTVIRVRVRSWPGIVAHGKPEQNEFRDYPYHSGDGDRAFLAHIRKIQEFLNGA